MSTLSTIITATLPLIGVALGAGLQYYFSKSSEERKKLTSLRTQAYVDYLQSVAKFAQAAKTDPNERLKLLAEAADAKTRICIYGSKNIVKLLAEFERNGAKIASRESKETFIALCSQMRAEGINSEENLPVDDLKLVLFGLEK